MSEWEKVHSHCLTCFLVQCPSPERGCPLIKCPNCAKPLHECKVQDHIENICPLSLVPCCNETNGCSAKLSRSDLGMHLQHCPASVLPCHHAYVRIQDKHSKNYLMPFSPATPSIILDLLKHDLAFIKSRGVIDLKVQNISTFDESRVAIDCVSMHDFPNLKGEQFLANNRTCCLSIYRLHQIYTYRYALACVYFCDLLVRRKDFSDHMRDHKDLCDELSFKIHHCPMSQYGCSFNCTEIKPTIGALQYNPDLRSLFITLGTTPVTQSATDDSFNLLTLPIEVLVYLVSFLDCYALFCLSQTCTHLRNVCEGFLARKGVVYALWRKDNSKWTTSKLVSKLDA